MRFYLGTHMPGWLAVPGPPVFVSHVRLARGRRLPVAARSWALDSGGFTEVGRHGRWVTGVEEYVDAVERYTAEVGGMEWAAPMDWMCEPHVLAATRLSVREHQARTVANYLELRGRGPFVPVLQGWSAADYEACVEMYADAGVDLTAEERVGLGTVCRRQDTDEIAAVVGMLADMGLRLHGFGMKSRGVARVGHLLASADSMAWSSRARNAWHHDRQRLCGGVHRGGCANCAVWAERWRDRVVDGLGLFADAR